MQGQKHASHMHEWLHTLGKKRKEKSRQSGAKILKDGAPEAKLEAGRLTAQVARQEAGREVGLEVRG